MMDVPTLMHNLKEEVTCSVCIHLYTNPKQLPCLHIFCLECLNDLARTSARHGKIKCPICQTEVAVPESGTMETLPSCFYVKNLLDTLAIKEYNTSKVTCGNCDEKSEEASYCFHCGGFWCKLCLNGHNILRANKGHRVLSLKDFQDEDFEDVLKRPAFCQKDLHEKEVLKFYCKVCEVPVCHTCVIVDHNKHDVEHLEVTARATKNNLSTELDAAMEASNAISSYIREFEEVSRILEHRSQTVKGQIQETAKSLTISIHRQEEELIAKVENETKTLVERNMKQIADLQDKLKKAEEFIRQAKRLLERSTGAELVRSKTATDEHFSELEPIDTDPDALLSTTGWTMFLKNEELSQIIQESRIGHLVKSTTVASQCSVDGFQGATAGLESQFEVNTRNSHGEQCYCPGDYIAVDFTSTQGSKHVGAELKIIDRSTGSYTILFTPREAGQHTLTVRVNGKTIKKIPSVDITERFFKPVRFVGEGNIDEKLLSPWGVAVNDSNDMFVTDQGNDRIVVLNEKGEFIRSFGQNLVNLPTGICIDKEGRIFVANRHNNKIILFSSKGEYVTEVHDGRLLDEPRGISIDGQGNLIVCDTENKCVKFISPDGSILKTIGEGWLGKLFHCLCYKDKIFVSDRRAHLIKVFSYSDGKFLYEFGKNGTDANLPEPGGLTIDKTGHILVCSGRNHSVQVFTLGGKFVTKFGECGNKLGQMNHPLSVSMLNNGHIVVCEFVNNRLQIFE